jgi:hypothetical protein
VFATIFLGILYLINTYFRWPTQRTALSTPPTLRTIGRTIMMSIRRGPLHLLLSKCWLCNHKCSKPCSRPWSICNTLNLREHHRCRGIGLEIFNALSRSPSRAVELMDGDDWLKFVEKKLQVVQCSNCEKVLLASHQLSGPTADLWDAYVEAH